MKRFNLRYKKIQICEAPGVRVGANFKDVFEVLDMWMRVRRVSVAQEFTDGYTTNAQHSPSDTILIL